MRLRGCVAIELLVGAIIMASLSGGAVWGVTELRGASASGTASAAAFRPGLDRVDRPGRDTATDARPGDRSGDAPASISGDRVEGVPAEPAASRQPPWVGQFLGQKDEALIGPLRDSPIAAVKVNRGGSSLSLRVDFESGGRAACKPNQIHMHSQPRREIAAYRFNRLLGLSSVPPSVGRRFRVAEIAERFKLDGGRARFMAEIVPDRENAGTVVSELTWWIPVLEAAKIDSFEIDSTEGVVTWKRHLTVGQKIPEASMSMASQVSEMLLFDFLINNSDRWSGSNIKMSQGNLVLIDNTLSFGGDPNGHNRVRTYLYRSQKFSRRLIERLRGLADSELQDALTRDIEPFAELLDRGEIAALLKRRDIALAYVDELIRKHGEEAVLAFP